VAIEHRAQAHARVHVGHADQHADAAIGSCSAHSIWSRSLEVSLSIEDQSRLRRSCAPGAAGSSGMGLNGGQLGVGSGGKSGWNPCSIMEAWAAATRLNKANTAGLERGQRG
jgi:hypothetical protein